MRVRMLVITLFVATGVGTFAGHALSQSGEAQPGGDGGADKMPSPDDMQKMFEEYAKIIRPSAKHKVLERFLGKWDYTMRFWLMGPEGPATELKGTSETTWLVEGMWLSMQSTGDEGDNSMVQAIAPTKTFGIMGYDNYKKKFVTVRVQDKSTALGMGYGNLTRDGKALISYGFMDEPMTGELDKVVKYVYRFRDPDHMTLEVHDLAIGETHTKVAEVEYRRKKP